MESEGSYHESAFFIFECPNCKDTERRLLPRNHALVVETSAAPAIDANAYKQTVGQPTNEDAKPPEELVTASNKVDHFLDDPAKFIQMFVRNPDRNPP
jgi:hypothetical protein